MARYMMHLVNDGHVPENAKQLLGRARQLCGTWALVRDCRVSGRFVEFDVSVNEGTADELAEQLLSIGGHMSSKLVAEEEIPKEAAIRLGVEYFNSERFWECHEVLEGVWKRCLDAERDLVQGIILVAAALVHYQKFENKTCISIFGRALEKLENSRDEYCGISVSKMRNTVSGMRESGKPAPFLI